MENLEEKTQILERMVETCEDRARALLEKYLPENSQTQIVSFKGVDRNVELVDYSHFTDTIRNLSAPLKSITQSLRLKGRNGNWDKLRKVYITNIRKLGDYLTIVENSPEVRESEMGTQRGYLEQRNIKNGYPSSEYVDKLKELLERK